MLDLTFGEQVKIILSRKGMTIKELAETIEERTGKKMSRQNLTQRLGRDNFQEQDMRMIAEILGCPFRLSILADSESIERASNIEEIEPTDRELSKITKSKEKKIKKQEDRQEESAPKAVEAERDITIGELVDIHEGLDALIEEEHREIPATGLPIEEIMEEVEVLEDEVRSEGMAESEIPAAEEPEEADEELPGTEEPEKKEPEKKEKGWKAYLKRMTRRGENGKNEDEQESSGTAKQEKDQLEELENIYAAEETELPEEAGGDDIDTAVEQADGYEAEYIAEAEQVTEDEDLLVEDEDLDLGDVNPYTGHEFETNSVRVHPKRIGYVQVYDRGEHKWTDMTEWAFLGYQERKKALLGNDYEPPIYLD